MASRPENVKKINIVMQSKYSGVRIPAIPIVGGVMSRLVAVLPGEMSSEGARSIDRSSLHGRMRKAGVIASERRFV
jgi:hypothetical protein